MLSTLEEKSIMKKTFVAILAATIVTALPGPTLAGSPCQESDDACKQFSALAENDQHAKIIEMVDPGTEYSETARTYIGKAYLGLAAAESNTPEQEEAFCRKALEYGAVQAYMGLYFIHAQKDEAAALGFLKQYVSTRPKDSVPYVILGESELDKQNYRLADEYLRESKKVARASSPRVDWMLFQVNYLLGNFKYASEMFENAVTNGRFEEELKVIARDSRFKGINNRPEFRKHRPLFAGGDGRS